MGLANTLMRRGELMGFLEGEGRIFYGSDAAQGDLVTGQTSFATTTPTWLLRVPSGTTAMPFLVSATQAGTVAGGVIDFIVEIDNADRFSSGGTTETVLNSKTAGRTFSNNCTLLSGATATDAYGDRVFGIQVGQDVEPAEGAVQEILWTPTVGADYLVGPASLLVYTFAASTGPSWYWTIKWAEFPSGWLD